MGNNPKAAGAIARADRATWLLFYFGLVRFVCWVGLIVCVSAGLLGVPGFAWAKHAAVAIAFVSLVSLYANATTDLNSVIGAWAAIRAGRAQAQAASGESSGLRGFAEMLSRIDQTTDATLDELRNQEDA